MWGEKIDQETLEDEASRTNLYLNLERQRRLARHMLVRLWPMVQELRSELRPLEEEHARWSAVFHSCDRRIAQLDKTTLRVATRRKRQTEKPLSSEDLRKHLATISQVEREAFLKELKELVRRD